MSKDSTTPVTSQLHIPIFNDFGQLMNFIKQVISVNVGRREAKLYQALHKYTDSYNTISQELDYEISDSQIANTVKKYGKK